MLKDSIPSAITWRSLLLNPTGGAAVMAALVVIEVMTGGWPTTPVDGAAFLAIFNLIGAFVVMVVITDGDDWKEDVRRGTKPFERYRLMKLMAGHAGFALLSTVVGAAAIFSVSDVGIVLAGTLFVVGSVTMAIMLLGRP